MSHHQPLPTGCDLNGLSTPGMYLNPVAAKVAVPATTGQWISYDRDGYRHGRLESTDGAVMSTDWIRKLPDGKWTQVLRMSQTPANHPAWAGNIAQQKRTKH